MGARELLSFFESRVMMRVAWSVVVCLPLFCACFASPVSAQDSSGFQIPKVSPEVASLPFPRISATTSELQRLRAALVGNDEAAKRVVVARVREADEAIKRPPVFPPRGGQHNQWYQCEDCQLALSTEDAEHHRCHQCKRVYTGEPYDDVIFSRVHSANLKAALATAWAHALTGEKKYAQYAAEVLLGYAQRYRGYPYHTASRDENPGQKKAGGHLYEQTLSEASAMATSIAPTYDLVCASGVLSSEQDQIIQEGLLRPMLANIAKNKSGKSNWQTWHNAAMIAGGGVLGETQWIERAISDPNNGFVDQMKVSVSADGMWYENSWAYHFYTLRAMIHLAEYGRRLDVDLWSHPRLKSMFTIAPGYAMPGGFLPRFGDDVNSRVASASSALEFFYRSEPDQSLTSFLFQQPTWDSIMLGRKMVASSGGAISKSELFPTAGHAILRSGQPAGLSTVMTFGPYGGFHGHFDKLSFVFFGMGRELGVDPGRARSQAYRLPIHRNWYKATLSHNAVVVDKTSQAPASGELLLFEHSEAASTVIARCNAAYPGVKHTRLVMQTNDYLLVFDDLRADAERRFDWFYHNRGQSVRCEAARDSATPDAGFAGMEYVQNMFTGRADDQTRITFEMKGMQTVLTLDAAKGTDILIGDGVGSSVLERVPMVRVTRQGKSARFAAVLEPVAEGGLRQVKTVQWSDQDDGSILIRIQGEDLSDQIKIAPDWKATSLK